MAAPKAEAKAEPYYSFYGLGHSYGYRGLYGGYGYGHYYGKRSADAEAAPSSDPYYSYNGIGHYSYIGYPYAYSGYSHYYGKRSADTVPAAKADPYYGVYGKRSAEAAIANINRKLSSNPFYTYYGLGYAGFPYAYDINGYYYGKRSADASSNNRFYSQF